MRHSLLEEILRSSSNKTVRSRKKRKKSDGVDRISDLCDDILFKIISLMDIKEAVITSSISRRWQHLWKYSIKHLNFCFSTMETTQLFQERVNSVLDQYLGSDLAELGIFYFGTSPGLKLPGLDYVDRWISFALAKKVTKLALFVKNTTFPSIDDDDQESSLEHVMLSGFRMNGCSFRIFKGVKSLRLSGVELQTCDLENIISTCSSLEKLHVACVYGLQHAKIVAPSPSLKRLTFHASEHLERIQISAPQLIECQYFGPKLDIILKNCSNLVKLELILLGVTRMTDILGLCEKHLFQLETLIMEIIPHEVKFAQLPTLPNLKTLYLGVHCIKLVKHIAFASLLKALPNLRQFTLLLSNPLRISDIDPEIHNESIKMGDDCSEWRHTCLEEFYVKGFCGYKYELEFLNLLLISCTSLMQITFDTKCFTGEERIRRRYRATRFAKHVEHLGVKFVVL